MGVNSNDGVNAGGLVFGALVGEVAPVFLEGVCLCVISVGKAKVEEHGGGLGVPN
jgi:hypothetical protein